MKEYEQGERDAVGREEGAEEGQRRHGGSSSCTLGTSFLSLSVSLAVAAVIGVSQGQSLYSKS